MKYSIGQASRAVGVKNHILRYWEQVIPLLHPEKSRAGHRVYSSADLRLLSRLKYLVVDKKFSVEGAYARLLETPSSSLTQLAMIREELQKTLLSLPQIQKSNFPPSPVVNTIPSELCLSLFLTGVEDRYPIQRVALKTTHRKGFSDPLMLCSLFSEEQIENLPDLLLGHLGEIQQLMDFRGQHLVCTHFRMKERCMEILLRHCPCLDTRVLSLPFFSETQTEWQIVPLFSLFQLLSDISSDSAVCYVVPRGGHIDWALIETHDYYRPIITLSAKSVGSKGLSFRLPMVITLSRLPEILHAIASCIRREVKLVRKNDEILYMRQWILRQSDIARCSKDVKVCVVS